jgi:hypothetical protein
MERVLLSRVRQANAQLQQQLHGIAEMLAGRARFAVAEVRAIAEPLEHMAPLLAEGQRMRSGWPELDAELNSYAQNLRALQTGLDRVRLVMLARCAGIEAQRGHLEAVGLWAAAWQQTR